MRMVHPPLDEWLGFSSVFYTRGGGAGGLILRERQETVTKRKDSDGHTGPPGGSWRKRRLSPRCAHKVCGSLQHTMGSSQAFLQQGHVSRVHGTCTRGEGKKLPGLLSSEGMQGPPRNLPHGQRAGWLCADAGRFCTCVTELGARVMES